MTARWLPVEITFHSLHIQHSNIEIIEADAFATKCFDKLNRLTFLSLAFNELQAGVFNKLINLEYLSISNTRLKTFDASVLVPCRALIKFSINSCNYHTLTMYGSENSELPLSLTTLDISRNTVADTINNKSFIGYKQVEVLLLNNDRIRFIGENSFDQHQLPKLMILDLSTNELITLTFNEINFPTHSIEINLHGNLWHCDSKIDFVIKFAKANHPSNVTVCWSPPELAGKLLVELPSIWACKEIDEMNLDSVITIASNDSASGFVLHLSKPLVHRQQLQEFLSGEVPPVPHNKLPNLELIVLIAEMGVVLNNPKCYATNRSDFERNLIGMRSTLKPKQSYQFCLIEKHSTVIHPLNCIAYFVVKDSVPDFDSVWIGQRDRITMLMVCILAGLLSFLFGTLITFITIQCCDSGSNQKSQKET